MAISGIPACVCAAPPEPGAGCSRAEGGGKVREVEARCGGWGKSNGRAGVELGWAPWRTGGRQFTSAGSRAATPALWEHSGPEVGGLALCLAKLSRAARVRIPKGLSGVAGRERARRVGGHRDG